MDRGGHYPPGSNYQGAGSDRYAQGRDFGAWRGGGYRGRRGRTRWGDRPAGQTRLRPGGSSWPAAESSGGYYNPNSVRRETSAPAMHAEHQRWGPGYGPRDGQRPGPYGGGGRGRGRGRDRGKRGDGGGWAPHNPKGFQPPRPSAGYHGGPAEKRMEDGGGASHGSRWGGLQRSKSAPMMPPKHVEGARTSASAKRSLSMERAAPKSVGSSSASREKGSAEGGGLGSKRKAATEEDEKGSKKAQYSPAESSLEDGEERIEDVTADSEVADLNDGMPKMSRRVSAVEELLGTNSPSPSPQDLNSEDSNDEREKDTPEKDEKAAKEETVKTPRLGWGGGLKAKLGWVSPLKSR